MGVHVSTIPEGAPQALLDLDFDLFVAKCAAVSVLSIALYGWLVCLEDEIELLWKASHSVFKYLALFCRYQAIICSLGVAMLRLGDWTREECGNLKLFAAITTDFALLSVAYVLALRTAAIYCFQRNVTILITLAVSIQTVLAIWATTGWVVIEVPPVIPGCFVRPGMGSKLGVALYWFPTSVTDLILLALTIGRLFPVWSSSTQTRLSWILLRDQIFYYAVITALSIPLDVLMFLGQNALASAFVPIALTLRPVLT